MGGCSKNTDFQSELLRMNGALQASITELRYHCEVYRLSLKSICRVLLSVQKEQDTRLRYLTTSRPSFQAYLLNLSQKQALDRIKNVVRKASTFINGYALVDRELFQPPPPKPSTTRRSADENKTAPATNTSTKLTDDSRIEQVSKSNAGSTSPATMILPVILEEVSAIKEYDEAEAASTKNNNGEKVERKQHSSSRRRRRDEEERKRKSGIRSKSKSRASSKSSLKHSSTIINEIQRRNGDDDDDMSSGEIKTSRRDKKKSRKRTDNNKSFSALDGTNKRRSKEEKKSRKKTRSKSIKTICNQHDDDHRHHQHHHQVINSRNLPNQQDEKLIEEDNEVGTEGLEAGELSDTRNQLSPLISQSDIVANRIPPLLSIATLSTIKTNKSFGTSHESEQLRTGDRRVGRPSKEKQYEGRRGNINCNRSDNQQNGEREKGINIGCWSNGSIRLKEIQENKTIGRRTSTNTYTNNTARRWGNNTIAAAAGYKVRESLAVLRNRNSGNTYQGQGVVTRKYLFSSHNKPRNDFKLNSATNLFFATATEKVRRVQLNGSGRQTGSFGGYCSFNEEKPYGAPRKFVSSSIRNNNNRGNGNGNCISSNDGSVRNNNGTS